MRALYISQLSGNPERLQGRDDRTIMGAKMFEWSFLCALLKYGTYDTYFAPGVTDQKKDELVADGLTAHFVRRLAPLPLGSPLPVEDSDQVVLAIAGRELNILATLRQKLQRYDAPLCGFIHSINSARIAVALLQHCFAGLSEADLLFCSSRAGMKTIDVYVEEIGRLLPPDMSYPARRALVPLGVEVPTVEQGASSTLRQRLNVETACGIALYFGRLSQTSKCDLGPLLVALSHLLARGTNLHLVIAGDDTQTKEAPRLQTLANELGCLKSVTIWPNPSAGDKHLLYSGADIFVSPSDNIQETYGLTVAEAMAYGLPAVVSDWDGYRDLVKDGDNGFLVPSIFPTSIEMLRLCDCTTSMLEEDSLAQSTTIDVSILSERLEKLALDQALRRRMGQAAKQYVEKHCSWQVVVKRYEELWEESLQIAKAAKSNNRTYSRLLNLSLTKSFGHYASEKRSDECKCFITGEGREWLKQPARLYFLCHLSANPRPRKFVNMLREISDCPGRSVGQVVELFVNDADPTSEVDAHWTLGRLFKYGLVTSTREDPISEDAGPATNRKWHGHGFAAVIPVGSEANDIERLSAVVESLCFHEDQLKWLVLIDDAVPVRPLTSLVHTPKDCVVACISNPWNGYRDGPNGGLCTGLLSALAWVTETAEPDFVLKLDLDALVIRPFAKTIRRIIVESPDVGLIGVVGRTCDRSRKTYGFEESVPSPLIEILNLIRGSRDSQKHFWNINRSSITGGQLEAFVRLRSHIEHAELNGYSYLHYCQGGAYAISPSMLRGLTQESLLGAMTAWMEVPVNEDVIMGMYAYAVGKKLLDSSREGQLFGLHWRGLPFGLKELHTKGYSIIHSTKNNKRYTEQHIRSFFKSIRTSEVLNVD